MAKNIENININPLFKNIINYDKFLVYNIANINHEFIITTIIPTAFPIMSKKERTGFCYNNKLYV